MALKQVPISEIAEPDLKAICKARKDAKKPYGRKLIVAEAIALLRKQKEFKSCEK